MSFHDAEAQYDGADFDSEPDTHDPRYRDAGTPLISRTSRAPRAGGGGDYYRRHRQEVIELDDIPPIIKSSNGNVFWADEQCTRRVGLTATEARLFWKLLQVDEPETLEYGDYRDMFDDFGREEARLRELLAATPWYQFGFDTWRQRSIWRARIEWLQRMEEPRLWLLYLMARRRRIIKKAVFRVRGEFRKRRERRLGLDEGVGNGHVAFEDAAVSAGEAAEEREGVRFSIGEDFQHLPLDADIPNPEGEATDRPTMVSEAAQTSDALLPSRLRNFSPSRIVSTVRRSISSGRHRSSHSHSHSRNSHSRDSRTTAGHCPIFERPFEATRKDIKKQVELLMPPMKPYIVIGWFLRSASDPKERTLQFDEPSMLFKTLKKGERDVRGWRRLVSLKSLKGFGLYKCDISRGAHHPLLLTTPQKAILSQFHLAYAASYMHADDAVATAWQGWVQKNLNCGNRNPLEGRYSLQLIYDWSAYRLTLIFAVPLLLSIAIGIWYMTDRGDTITAWTLSLYIVTAAAAIIALLAIIGSLKDI